MPGARFEYGGGRQVTVYVPPNPPEAIVFAGDGQGISKWGPLSLRSRASSAPIVPTDHLLNITRACRYLTFVILPCAITFHGRPPKETSASYV